MGKLNGRTYIRSRLYYDEAYYNFHRKDAEHALTGAVRFISSMAGVDGLVLLSSAFAVEGFGVEITTKQEVSALNVATSPSGESTPLNKSHYGTRHRSMFRYCSANPGSLGFVVSQDGDIRAITSIRGRLTIFENVKIHSHWDDDLQKMVKGIGPKKIKAVL
jgi:hypothetical protein